MEISAIMNIYDLAANRKDRQNGGTSIKQKQISQIDDEIPMVQVVAKEARVAAVEKRNLAATDPDPKADGGEHEVFNGRIVDIMT